MMGLLNVGLGSNGFLVGRENCKVYMTLYMYVNQVFEWLAILKSKKAFWG